MLSVSRKVVSNSFVTPWTVAFQALLFVGFPRQEMLECGASHFPGDLPNLGIEPTSLVSPALAGRFFTAAYYLGSPENFEVKTAKCL